MKVYFQLARRIRNGVGAPRYAVRKHFRESSAGVCADPIESDAGLTPCPAAADLANFQREKERIQAAFREKDVLLSEIHHRIANNLQVLFSLMDLQSRAIPDPATRSILRDSRARILSMAVIHQTLYGSMDFARVDFASFAETLLPAVIELFDVDPGRFRIVREIEPLRLPIDTAMPCGLMLNELVTNALKHAFPDRDQGEIRIALARQTRGEIRLSVSDNGIGLPDRAARSAGGLGMKLIGLLTEQINGTISIQRRDPTEFVIRFPG